MIHYIARIKVLTHLPMGSCGGHEVRKSALNAVEEKSVFNTNISEYDELSSCRSMPLKIRLD